MVLALLSKASSISFAYRPCKSRSQLALCQTSLFVFLRFCITISTSLVEFARSEMFLAEKMRPVRFPLYIPDGATQGISPPAGGLLRLSALELSIGMTSVSSDSFQLVLPRSTLGVASRSQLDCSPWLRSVATFTASIGEQIYSTLIPTRH